MGGPAMTVSRATPLLIRNAGFCILEPRLMSLTSHKVCHRPSKALLAVLASVRPVSTLGLGRARAADPRAK
jgi:hypothetical protein